MLVVGGDASVNEVFVGPARGLEFRFPAPVKMLNAATCVSDPSIGSGEDKNRQIPRA